MKKYLFFIIQFSLLLTCSEKSAEDSIITASIEEDYSTIADPKERWQAYNLQDYVLDESIGCNCPPPTGIRAIIINNEVADVEYEIDKDYNYNRTKKEIYNQMMHFAMTVDEAFEFTETFTDAQIIEIEYDPRFGFPSRIFVDEDSMMIDEEFTRRFYNLEKIVE